MAQTLGFMANTTQPKPATTQPRLSPIGGSTQRPLMQASPALKSNLLGQAAQQGVYQAAPRPSTLAPQPGAFNPSFPTNSALRQPGVPIQGTAPGTNMTDPKYNSLYDIGTYNDKNSSADRFIGNTLPLTQFTQNQYQYGQDFNESQRRYDTDTRWNKEQGIFDMGLATQQQQMAEWQANEQAAQWRKQFGHTAGMDLRGAGQRDTELANQLRMGLDQSQANRDVAGTYAGAQRYGADVAGRADMYGADQYSGAQRYGAEQAAGADRYGADQTLRGAGLYAGAQRYGADVAGRADMYGADQTLAGAGLYSQAQRYQAEQARLADIYGADRGVDVAGVYGGAQRYGSDQQLRETQYQWDMQNRINQAQMANNLQVANTQAYGRSAAPGAQWASAWA